MSLKRIFSPRIYWRLILSPVAWISVICACALYTCFSVDHGNGEASGRQHQPEEWSTGKLLRKEKGVMEGPRRRAGSRPQPPAGSPVHQPGSRPKPPVGGPPRRSGPGRRPQPPANLTDRGRQGPWYEEYPSTEESSHQDVWEEREDPEVIENVTCRLGLRHELNAQYKVMTDVVDLLTVEETFFGSTRNDVVLYVARMRAILDVINRLPSSRFLNHDGYRRENERGIEIGNYTYYAGGHWRPNNCEPRWKVAIVVPFRDRDVHLAIFLRNLVPLLLLQKLEFRIFVAEQANSLIFNRGLMKNAGYVEATRFGWWDCVVFHDIDQVPMRGANYYGCDGMPRHLCARPEEMGFSPQYELLFGGVVGLTAEQMERTNGYSNFYWGWGGEDDDLFKRLYREGYKPTRDLKEGFYKTLNHAKKTKSQMSANRYCLLEFYYKRMSWDGISNTTDYKSRLKLSLLYTHVYIDARRESWNSGFAQCREDIIRRQDNMHRDVDSIR